MAAIPETAVTTSKYFTNVIDYFKAMQHFFNENEVLWFEMEMGSINTIRGDGERGVSERQEIILVKIIHNPGVSDKGPDFCEDPIETEDNFPLQTEQGLCLEQESANY